MDQTQINGAPDPDRSDPGLDAAQTPTFGLAQTPTFVVTPTSDQTQTPDPGLRAGSGRGDGQTRPPTPTPDPDPIGKIGNGRPVGSDHEQTPTPDQTPTGDQETKSGRDWTALGMWAVIIVLNVLALLLASSGQVDGTWLWAGLSGDDSRKWLLPGITEVGYLGFLLLGADALRREQSPFIWWGGAGMVAGAAVFMNSVHGEDGHKWQQGLIFGVASAVSLAMTFAKFLIDYRAYRRRQGHTTGLRPRALTFGALTFLPLAFRAHLIIARCERVKTRERAYELAEMWRWIFQDTKAAEARITNRRAARKTARRTAWITVYEELGQRVPELTNITVRKVTFRELPPQPEPAPEPPTRVPSTLGAPPKPRAADGARPRRADTRPPDEPDDDETPAVVLEKGKPLGTAGANWMSLQAIMEEIVRPLTDDVGQELDLVVDLLPFGLADTTCECRADATKRCGKTVRHHVERRGKQVVPIMRGIPNWATREKRITIADVLTICGISGKEQRIEITGLFDHLRKLAQEQSARSVGNKVINGGAPAIEPPPPDAAAS